MWRQLLRGLYPISIVLAKSTGDSLGWVNPELVTKYGLATNTREAWETNGGGKFSFKNQLGMLQPCVTLWPL